MLFIFEALGIGKRLGVTSRERPFLAAWRHVGKRPEADFRLGDVFYLRAFGAAYLASEGDGVEFDRVQEYAAGHAGGMSS